MSPGHGIERLGQSLFVSISDQRVGAVTGLAPCGADAPGAPGPCWLLSIDASSASPGEVSFWHQSLRFPWSGVSSHPRVTRDPATVMYPPAQVCRRQDHVGLRSNQLMAGLRWTRWHR